MILALNLLDLTLGPPVFRGPGPAKRTDFPSRNHGTMSGVQPLTITREIQFLDFPPSLRLWFLKITDPKTIMLDFLKVLEGSIDPILTNSIKNKPNNFPSS